MAIFSNAFFFIFNLGVRRRKVTSQLLLLRIEMEINDGCNVRQTQADGVMTRWATLFVSPTAQLAEVSARVSSVPIAAYINRPQLSLYSSFFSFLVGDLILHLTQLNYYDTNGYIFLP